MRSGNTTHPSRFLGQDLPAAEAQAAAVAVEAGLADVGPASAWDASVSERRPVVGIEVTRGDVVDGYVSV